MWFCVLLFILAIHNLGTFGQLALINSIGEPHIGEGWALLLYNGGTVCDDYFAMKEAHVICKQLRYAQALTWGSVDFPNGNRIETWDIQHNYDIKLDNVQCSSSSSSWSSCTYTSSIEISCIRTKDVHIYCTGKQSMRCVSCTHFTKFVIRLSNWI